jgi:hypothetical protein
MANPFTPPPGINTMRTLDPNEMVSNASKSAPHMPTYPPAPNPYLRSTLPLAQQFQPDALRQYFASGIPQTRMQPIQVSGNPQVTATAAGIAKQVSQQVASTAGGKPVILTMPVQYSVGTSENTKNELIDVSWLPVPAGYALMGPGPISALESTFPNSAQNSATINSQIIPTSATSWALFVEYSDNNLVAAPAGWTVLHSTASQNIYYQNVTGTTPVSVNAALSAPSSYVSVIFGFAGPFPPLVQTASGTIVGNTGGVTLSSPVTPGNVLWVIAQAYDGSTNFGINVSDSLNNTFDLISAQSVGASTHPAQTQGVFVCPSISSSGSDTITIEYFGSINPPDHKEFLVFETGPLTPGPGLPFFRQISPSEIPNLENLNGILPVARGGTGQSSPSLIAGTGISISGSWPDQTISVSGGGGGTPGGSSGDIQVNNGGAFGTYGDIQPGAAINVNSGALQFTGGASIKITNGNLDVRAGTSGNNVIWTNQVCLIDSNGNSVRLGTTFSPAIWLGGSSSSVGFFGTGGTTQQTITGSRGGNAALASLLTALSAMNLIVDSSTP